VIESLKAGKNIYVEKPLALSLSELNRVRDIYQKKKNILFVGYNRRYSPLAQQLKEFYSERREAMNIIYRVNAGYIPKSHWIQDPGEGGGRIIGEVCHFVDLIIFFTQSFPTSVFTTGLAIDNDKHVLEDNISSTFKFSDGSIATIIYTANGGDKMEKEYIEIFSEGKSAKLIDFKELHLFSGSKKSKIKFANQDKGQSGEIKYFFDLIKGYINDENSFEENYIASLATLKILESLRTGNPVTISN
jgi:polar amino acid transport system substrate-binding protein